MDMGYGAYVNPELELLVDRVHPPRVCIDNDSYQDCTLVKVDSPNKHGILLSMVQVLTDLDLVISKSYISSDGPWFMDVFHVTDRLGNKITDKSMMCHIQQSICASRYRGKTQQKTSLGKEIKTRHVSMEHTTLEMTATDRPGLLSEISAVLAQLRCHISAVVAWTHNHRAACIIHVDQDDSNMDPHRTDRVQSQLVTVMDAHHTNREQWSVRLSHPASAQTHTERRLHQLMMADKDYEDNTYNTHDRGNETVVTVENCKEKGYSVLNVTSLDRPKLLFDTICTFTDMQYVVFHATVSSKGPVAFQEYFIRKKDGGTLSSENQRQTITRSIIAGIERRTSHGLRLDVRGRNRSGLLSDVTRVLRENGLLIARAEIGIDGEMAVGSFHVRDVGGHDVDPGMVEVVKKEIVKVAGGVVLVENESWSSSWSSHRSSSNNDGEEGRGRLSLGTLLWSQLERISSKFQTVNSQPQTRSTSSEFIL